MHISEEIKKTLELPDASQVCIAVRDLDKAIEFYESVLGFGPFVRPEISYAEKEFLGKPTTSEWVMGFCSLGPIELELSQSVSGRNTYSDHIDRYGEGLHHLGFDISNLDERIERCKSLGLEVIMSGRTPVGGFAIVDTSAVGGTLIELIQRKSRRAPAV